MARILITRPSPDNRRTAEAVRARGHTPLLAPVIAFEASGALDLSGSYDGVIATSANAVRALRGHHDAARLADLPFFAVGAATAAAAREQGFARVLAGAGSATDLHGLVARHFNNPAGVRLLYLAGADISHDLAGSLAREGFAVQMRVVYRMMPVTPWPAPQDGDLGGAFDVVLHYSAQSARLFAQSAERSALHAVVLSAAHLCLSEQVARVLRGAGYRHVAVAAQPNEAALLDAVDVSLRTIRDKMDRS